MSKCKWYYSDYNICLETECGKEISTIDNREFRKSIMVEMQKDNPMMACAFCGGGMEIVEPKINSKKMKKALDK